MSLSDSLSATRPLPLKQRTSSLDARRDYTNYTWISLLRLLKPREYFITVDNFSIWRRHMAWAMEGEGSDLRGYICQRYASSMVFMSLLLGTALNVLFNSDKMVTDIRQDMRSGDYFSFSFWAGFTMLLSVILTILSIISTFTAWGMVNAVSDSNAHCILRSSIGQYVAELPGRFIVASIYCFLIWVVLLCIILLPSGFWSWIIVLITTGLFVHVVVVFSAFGRIIMHTGAMGSQCIFESDFERRLLPHSLHSNLLNKAKQQLESKTSIMRQYRYPSKPLDGTTPMESATLTSNSSNGRPAPAAAAQATQPPPPPPAHDNTQRPTHQHRRTSSSVRFADNLLTSTAPMENSPLARRYAPYNFRLGNSPNHATARPPRPPQIITAGARSRELSELSQDGLLGEAVGDWLDGSPKSADTHADQDEKHNHATVEKLTEPHHSILHPSSYSRVQQSSSALEAPDQDKNRNVTDVPLIASAPPPVSKPRKYFGGTQTTLSDSKMPMDTSVDSTSVSPQQVTTPSIWGSTSTRTLNTSDAKNNNVVPMSDTQRAAMAATDAVTRLLSRQSDRKNRNQPARTTLARHRHLEYGTTTSLGGLERGAKFSRQVDPLGRTTFPDTTTEPSEQHPLLQSDKQESTNYNTSVSKRDESLKGNDVEQG